VFVMLASLLMAVAIPEGFGDHAMLFASYCVLQIGRNGFVVAVTPPGRFHRNFEQILTWSVLSAPLWIGGALAVAGARWALWLAAMGIDLAAPLVRYWRPRWGPTPTEWEIDAGHFAERFQLFVIIVLGESIVLTGATATDVGLTSSVVVALGVAFLSSVALWWLAPPLSVEVMVARCVATSPAAARSSARGTGAEQALDVRCDGHVPGGRTPGRASHRALVAGLSASWFSEGFAVTLWSFSRSLSTGRMKKALSRSSAIVVRSALESPPSMRSRISSGSGGAMSMCSRARMGISVAVKRRARRWCPTRRTPSGDRRARSRRESGGRAAGRFGRPPGTR
jgi:Bacterial low temperature requirement A protein (LtrA)